MGPSVEIRILATMEFQDVVRHRRMVRDYSDEPVDPAVIDLALANAVRAPSAGFSQGWAFLVLDQPADIARFWEVTTTPGELPDSWLRGMTTAPVVIIPCSSKAAYLDRYAEPDKGWTDLDEARWPVPFWHMDAAMASLLILLTAVDEGLGACFFGIPDDHDPVGVITIGHRAGGERPSGSPRTRKRRDLGELVHRGQWGR